MEIEEKQGNTGNSMGNYKKNVSLVNPILKTVTSALTKSMKF